MNSELTQTPLLQLEKIVTDVIEPNALENDREGRFPRDNIHALATGKILGLISCCDHGGSGGGIKEAAKAVEMVSQGCASTGMILCMHYCASSTIDLYGPPKIAWDIGNNQHLSTLAISEFSSRSHFWEPSSNLITELDNGQISLSGQKAFVTSATEADSYLWSSRPLIINDPSDSTAVLVPSDTPGLSIPKKFDGLGLRGNSSSPITANNVILDKNAILGQDGHGKEIFLNQMAPNFLILCSAVSLGIMESCITKATSHICCTRFKHKGETLADLPTIRAYLARIRIKTDMIRALLADAIRALNSQTRQQDPLQNIFLEIKAAAGDSAIEVTDIAMRICGGSAFRKEFGLERNFRDARAAIVMSPTTDVLYDMIGKNLCQLPLFEQ